MTGIAEHAEQTDAEKHQTGWLGDDGDGEDAGGTVPAEGSGWERREEDAAAAARDIDTTDVAGKPTRPNFDEHPATTTPTAAEIAPTASLSAEETRTRERHRVTVEKDRTAAAATAGAAAAAAAAVRQDAAAD